MSGLKSKEQFLDGIKADNKDDFIFGDYNGYDSPMAYTCKNCGHETVRKRAGLLKRVKNISCQKCSNHGGFKKTNEILDYQLETLHHNTILRVGEYVDDNTAIDFYCVFCETIFTIAPGKLVQRRGCNICNMSKGEKFIKLFLVKENIEHKQHYKVDKFYYDFFLPEFNAYIEYDGEQHFKPTRFNGMDYDLAVDNFKKVQEYDRIKNELITAENAILLRIPYTAFTSLDNILANFIKQLRSETIPPGSRLEANASRSEESLVIQGKI